MKKFRNIKQLIPIFSGMVFILIVLIGKLQIFIPDIKFLANTIINCTVAFSGFVLTSISILIGLNATPIMKRIRQNGNIQELICYLVEPLVFGAMLIILGIYLGEKYATCAGTNVDTAKLNGCLMPYNEFMLLGGTGIAYIISLVLVFYFVLKILSASSVSKETDNKEPSVPTGKFRI